MSSYEIVLFHTLFALLHQPNPTIAAVSDFLTDERVRDRIVSEFDDVQAKKFWRDVFTNFTERDKQDVTRSVMNKLGQFLGFPAIRSVISQTSPRFELESIPRKKHIFIANLSMSTIGEHNTYLLGSLIISHLFASSLWLFKPEIGFKALPHYLIVDEYPSFGTVPFNPILSQARKLGLRLTIAHQFLDQLSDYARAAVLGNVSTFVVLKVSPEDGKALAPLFNYKHQEYDEELTSQDPIHAWIKRDFHNEQALASMLPPQPAYTNQTPAVIDQSRRRFARRV